MAFYGWVKEFLSRDLGAPNTFFSPCCFFGGSWGWLKKGLVLNLGGRRDLFCPFKGGRLLRAI